MEQKSDTVFVSVEDVRKRLKEADEALPEDVKKECQSESLEDIKKKYKNRWVALATTDVGEKFFPLAGRVVANAGKYERPLLEEQIRPLQERCDRNFFIFYTGRYESFDKQRKDLYFEKELKGG